MDLSDSRCQITTYRRLHHNTQNFDSFAEVLDTGIFSWSAHRRTPRNIFFVVCSRAFQCFTKPTGYDQKVIDFKIALWVMDLLSVFTKVALVRVLNYVQVRNVARSRHTYWLLKGALVVFLLNQIFRLIMTILAVYFSLLSSTFTNNSHRSLVESPLFNIEELLLLPLAIKTISVSRMLSKAFEKSKILVG